MYVYDVCRVQGTRVSRTVWLFCSLAFALRLRYGRTFFSLIEFALQMLFTHVRPFIFIQYTMLPCPCINGYIDYSS